MIDLRSVNRNRFSLAKRLWLASNTLKIVAFAVGAVAVFTSRDLLYIPQLILIVVCASEMLQWRSDVIKSRSESLLRRLDFCDAFQGQLSRADYREIISELPSDLRKQLGEDESPEAYFASSEVPGVRRAVENLIESAWYTRKLTESMVYVCIALIMLLLVISIASLIVASRELANVNAREGVSKVVTSWLLLVFSLGLVRNWWLYYKMFLRCRETESVGEYLLRGEVKETDALKLWHEYQIARSSAPLLPDWLWRLKQASLEDAWLSGHHDVQRG